MKFLKIGIMVLVSILLIGCSPVEWDFFIQKPSDDTERIPVELVKVVDGDTIRVKINGKEERVRYLLIDTPEITDNQLYAEEAKMRNKEILSNGDISISYDKGERRDNYDRLLAYVYVDGSSAQEKLLEEGLARVAYVFEPNTSLLSDFQEKEQNAKESDIGIWSMDGYVTEYGFDMSRVE